MTVVEEKRYERSFRGDLDQAWDLAEQVINDTDMNLEKRVALWSKIKKSATDIVRAGVAVESVKVKSPEGYRELRQLTQPETK